MAAIGLWYDDYVPGGSPVTPQLVNVLTYNTGVNANDTTVKTDFPYVQTPWSGDHNCDCAPPPTTAATQMMKTQGPVTSQLGMAAPGIEIATRLILLAQIIHFAIM